MTEPDKATGKPSCMPPDKHTRTPLYQAPPRACDAHCHVFGPRDIFPYSDKASYWPPDADKHALKRVHDKLGIERAVLVQASCHGTDNRAMIDAIASSNGAWRYINVRRLFIMVEASMDAGLQWVVFEPNDSTLWAKVRRDVSAFLRNVWRGGALFGTTPDQAFYVKCDEELNPADVRDLGQLIIEVGMAPVKPAEFVIFRISQWAGANAEG